MATRQWSLSYVCVFLVACAAGACGPSNNDPVVSSVSGGNAGSGGLMSTGGTSGSGGSGGTTNTGGFSGSSGSTTLGGSGGSTSACATSCDDGFSCTVDTCVGTTCQHAIGPNSGATACPTGQYCTAAKGCVAAPVCATTADCTMAWTGDACKSNIRCDAASSACLFDVLDKDKDGHPPVICGGDDCNDADPLIHPGTTDVCNGKDDNCNGVVDEDPIDCIGDGAKTMWHEALCVNATCQCVSPKVKCVPGPSYILCTDRSTDPNNCGKCDNVCATGQTCGNGLCI